MRKIDNFEEMKKDGNEVVSFASLPVGPQIVKIINVEDVVEKEYLRIEFDIAEGEFKDFFSEQFENFKKGDDTDKWPGGGTVYRSYKNTAYQFFTAFIIAIEKSNKKFVWNWDETDLLNKLFVANFAEEEYLGDGAELKVSMKCRETRSTSALKEDKVRLLTIKKLPSSSKEQSKPKERSKNQQNTPTIDVAEDDLPF
ncbi:MAG: hypothetical protein PF487_11780 [Bacteroidales bacterium]|jgi:hypothetical protein|nr:hypothetical protein [Bacteroidales bacterium]